MLTHKMVRRRPSPSMKATGQCRIAFREMRSRAEELVSGFKVKEQRYKVKEGT